MDVIPLWQGVCMVVSTARRVREGLAELIRLVNDPATPTGDLRVVLGECKAFGGQLAVLQADTAGGLATRERHGDGGVGALAQAAGLPRREAAGHVRTVKQLQELPSVRDAVENGDISVANARVLAATSDKTDAEQVQQDAELLAQAAVLSPEQFAREAGRWAARRQPDDAEERYRRQRARRRLGIWNGDDGMMHLRGELDPVTGAKVRKRFLLEAERLRRLDLRNPHDNKRTLDQRMADALDTLTSHGSIYAKTATTPNGSHDDSGGAKTATAPNGSHDGSSGTKAAGAPDGSHDGSSDTKAAGTPDGSHNDNSDTKAAGTPDGSHNDNSDTKAAGTPDGSHNDNSDTKAAGTPDGSHNDNSDTKAAGTPDGSHNDNSDTKAAGTPDGSHNDNSDTKAAGTPDGSHNDNSDTKAAGTPDGSHNDNSDTKAAGTPDGSHNDNSDTKAAGTPDGSHNDNSDTKAAGAPDGSHNDNSDTKAAGTPDGSHNDNSGTKVAGAPDGSHNGSGGGHVNGSGAGADEGRSGAAGAADGSGPNTGGGGHVNGSGAGVGDSRSGVAGNRCGCGGRPSADITIVQHLSADGTEAFAEIAGGEVIPRSVLEEHFCNARIKGVVFSSEGVPLWHGHSKRVATKAQTNALRARYGACGGCGADMWICQGHHVQAVSQGGPTNIDNMMLLCWGCHQKVHLHGWREAPDGRGLYTIEPPERTRHGPAHAPDPPPDHGPGPPRRNRQPEPSSTDKPETDPINPAAPPQPETLFTPA